MTDDHDDRRARVSDTGLRIETERLLIDPAPEPKADDDDALPRWRTEQERTWLATPDGGRELVDVTTWRLPDNEAAAAQDALRDRYTQGGRWQTEKVAQEAKRLLRLQSKGGGKGGKAKKAVRAIEERTEALVRDDPDATVAQLWERFPDEEHSDSDIYRGTSEDPERDGEEVLVAWDLRGRHERTRRTFETYVTKARKDAASRLA